MAPGIRVAGKLSCIDTWKSLAKNWLSEWFTLLADYILWIAVNLIKTKDAMAEAGNWWRSGHRIHNVRNKRKLLQISGFLSPAILSLWTMLKKYDPPYRLRSSNSCSVEWNESRLVICDFNSSFSIYGKVQLRYLIYVSYCTLN